MQFSAHGVWVRMIRRELLGLAATAALLPAARLPAGQGQRSGDVLGDAAGAVAVGAFESLATLAIPVGTDLIRTNEHSAGTGLGGAFYVYDKDVDQGYVAANPCTSRISSNGRGFRLSLDQPISPGICGAVGDGLADDTAAFRAAIATGVGTINVPSGHYRITGMLELFAQVLVGEGREYVGGGGYGGGTHIFAGAAMPAVVKVVQGGGIRHATIDAKGLADHAVLMSNSGAAHLFDIRAEYAKFDCILFAQVGNNNGASVEGSWIRGAGTGKTGYHKGKAAYTTNSHTVTITGAADLTTLGIRPTWDFVYVAGKGYRIHSLTATTLSVFPAVDATASGQPYEIVIGSGIMIPSWGDNSCIKSINNSIQACPAAGIQDSALYGVHSVGDIIESCGWSHAIGVSGIVYTNHSRSIGLYSEGARFGYYLAEASIGAVLEPATLAAEHPEALSLPFAPSVGGLQYRTRRGHFVDERVYHSYPPTKTFDAEYGSAYVVNSTGAMTINLPAMAGNKAALARKLDNPIVFVFEAMSGTATFKSPDSTVNGVAGAKGITHTGNYTRREARYTMSGWTVTS